MWGGEGTQCQTLKTHVLDASMQTHMHKPAKHSPPCPYLMVLCLLLPLPIKEVAHFSKLALKTAHFMLRVINRLSQALS